MKKLLFLMAIMTVMSCTTEPDEVGVVEGMKPVYISTSENVIAVTEPRPFEDLGKIVYVSPFLLINERFKGIHIVDNSDPADPIKINFVQIPGNTDFTVGNGFLYANHGSDLKVFRFTTGALGSLLADFDLEETYVDSLFFAGGSNSVVEGLYPPNYTGFFECVDQEGAIVVNWEMSTLINPECRI